MIYFASLYNKVAIFNFSFKNSLHPVNLCFILDFYSLIYFYQTLNVNALNNFKVFFRL